ncbi:MAG TPA: class I SAM-dependent methyltransferase [Acidimicrobiales bacterium]|nr:class I SAM-dependent methyltransferase [Acidimicrobiales bacterium]
MAEFMEPRVVAYAEDHSTPLPAYLERVDEHTRENFPAWGMMVGRQEGRFLELVVFALGATRVLEIGTFTGFSSIAMAAGLAPGGAITTCEVDPVHVTTARANITASPYEDRIEVVEGPALATIEHLDGPFDFVFIDADKTGYDAYFEAVLPKLARRGLIALDNTLQRGEVLDPVGAHDGAVAIAALNDKLAADRRVVCAFTTIRDGVTLVRRA